MRRGGEVPLALNTQGPREEEVARPAYADKAYAYLSHVESFRGGAELPRVHVRLRGQGGHYIHVTALLDSGATHTFVPGRIANALGLNVRAKEGPAGVKVADGQSVPCQGVALNVPVQLGEAVCRWDLVVCDIDCDLILGWDFWRRFGLATDTKRGVIRVLE